MRSRGDLWAVLAAALAAAPAAVRASPLFEVSGAVDGDGGLSARSTGAAASSTYFNPALLADALPGFELGIFVLSDQIGIVLEARGSAPECAFAACDVPEVFGTGPESFRHPDNTPIDNPTVPTDWLEHGIPPEGDDGGFAARPRQAAGTGHNTRAYQVVGLVSPVFREKLVIGLYAMVPLSEFTTAKSFYNDEREQFFSNSLHPELYSDRLTATSLAFGVGSRVSRKLSLGTSFTLNLTNRAAAPVYVSDLSDLNTVLLDSDIGVEASVSPHFGAAYRATDDLQLAATVHTPQKFEIHTGFEYVLATGIEQRAELDFTHAYMPWTFALGGDWRLGELGLTATLQYALWSKYRDRHSERPSGDFAWGDTLSGVVGVRHRRGALTSHLDLAYQPSPVPPQTGRSNYVDNDRGAVSLGADYELRAWGGHFRVGASFTAQRLFTESVRKVSSAIVDEVPDDAVDGVLGDPIPNREGLQTNNPGFPGYESQGWMVGGGAHVAILY